MSCLFIKSTFSLEIIYSIITTYQILLTDVSILTNGNFALCGQRVFCFLMCCRQYVLSFRMPGNLNPRKGGTARSLCGSTPWTWSIMNPLPIPSPVLPIRVKLLNTVLTLVLLIRVHTGLTLVLPISVKLLNTVLTLVLAITIKGEQ
jgi:hypothetical protein